MQSHYTAVRAADGARLTAGGLRLVTHRSVCAEHCCRCGRVVPVVLAASAAQRCHSFVAINPAPTVGVVVVSADLGRRRFAMTVVCGGWSYFEVL